jgi:peptidyl-prolyl cis-trans isomerase B (cyclophilin B)
MIKAFIETERCTLVFELFDQEVPTTVRNFTKLVKSSFYEKLLFFRVIPNFVVQAGCSQNKGISNPNFTIPLETNTLHPHTRGSFSMANQGDNTTGSQFFICLQHEQSQHLNNHHCCIGRLIEGDAFLEKIYLNDRIERIWIE